MLIRKASKKDSAAFVTIAQGVHERLYHIASVYLCNETLACEAVDETMFRAWKAISRLRRPEYFDTWITRILINCCNAISRKSTREVLNGEMPDAGFQEYDSLPIRDAVERLPHDLRMVIALRFFSDLSIIETASILNLPEGTVKTRQRKALALLRVELEEIT